MVGRTSFLSRVVTALVVVGVSGAPAQAFAYTYFNGGYTFATNGGAACTIEVQNPQTGGGLASSSAWTMVSGSGAYQYMQIGWTEDNANGDESPRYFGEWSNSATQWGRWYSPGYATTGVSDVYRITSDATKYYLQVDGVNRLIKDKSLIAWTPSEVDFMGETYYQSDQCPGTSANHLNMGPASFKSSSGTWYSAGVAGLRDLTTMDNDIAAGDTSWTIWDTRY